MKGGWDLGRSPGQRAGEKGSPAEVAPGVWTVHAFSGWGELWLVRERMVLERIQSCVLPDPFSTPDGPGQIWLARGLGSDPEPASGCLCMLGRET